MSDIQPIINAQYFPNQFVSDAEKSTEAFGLRIGQAIQYEWFRKDSRSGRFYSQWRDFHYLKLYARGEQSGGCWYGESRQAMRNQSKCKCHH